MPMNSDKAADVADAINGCPSVIGQEDITPNYPGSDALTVTRRGVEWVHTGEAMDLENSIFAPAFVHQAGEIAFGDEPMRPCFEVVVPALNIPECVNTFLPSPIVYEIAKHGCLIRVLDDGSLRVRDDFQGVSGADTDAERCPCGSRYFKIHEGEPECVGCGRGRTKTKVEVAE